MHFYNLCECVIHVTENEFSWIQYISIKELFQPFSSDFSFPPYTDNQRTNHGLCNLSFLTLNANDEHRLLVNKDPYFVLIYDTLYIRLSVCKLQGCGGKGQG